MAWYDEWTYRLKSLARRPEQEQSLDEELQFHLEMEIEARMEAGASRREAEREARLAFGGVEGVKEACRDAWGTRLLDDLRSDVRGTCHHLWKAPAFTAAAVGSLALGIGAAATIFSVVDAVLLQPLSYHEPERLVALQELNSKGDLYSVSDPNLLDFGDRAQTLESVAAVNFARVQPSLGSESGRKRLSGLQVTPSFFHTLGVRTEVGRPFDAEEMPPGSDPKVVMLSHHLWRSHFGGDPSIVGQRIDLDGAMHTVLGVLPEGFRHGATPTDVYLPYILDPAYDRGDHRLEAYARLAPGVTVRQAREEIELIAAQLSQEYPDSNAECGAVLTPFAEYFFGPEIRRTNWMLGVAVALLLLLACVNVSNLMLARGHGRLAEMRLRLALGASRGRVLRQLMTESLVLGGLGALGGLLLASFAVPVVRALPVSLPRIETMALDGRAVVFGAMAALVACVVSGVAPAFRLVNTSAHGALGGSVRGKGSQGGGRLRSMLVVAEVALATVLTLGAGLLYQSFETLQRVDPGFGAPNLLLAQIDLPTDRYGTEERSMKEFFGELARQVESLPGVEAAGANLISPFRGPSTNNQVATHDTEDMDDFTWSHWRTVTENYFQAAGVPMLQGRSFDDTAEPAMEVIISADLAKRLWPDGQVLGRLLRWGDPKGPVFEVIGVVAEVQDLHLGEDPEPMIYLPQRMVGWPSMTLAIRTTDAPMAMADAVHAMVREADPVLAEPVFSTFEGQRREALSRPLLSLRLMGAFAIIALLLAAVGVYGIVAYAVRQRRFELGLRVAMGAQPRQLLGLVLRRSVTMVSVGLLLGLLASLALAGSLEVLLYETSPFDPRVLGTVALLLIGVGLLSSWVPARRATQLDPATVLRSD